MLSREGYTARVNVVKIPERLFPPLTMLPTPNMLWVFNSNFPTLQYRLGIKQFYSILTLIPGVSADPPQAKGSVPQDCPRFRCQLQMGCPGDSHSAQPTSDSGVYAIFSQVWQLARMTCRTQDKTLLTFTGLL